MQIVKPGMRDWAALSCSEMAVELELKAVDWYLVSRLWYWVN